MARRATSFGPKPSLFVFVFFCFVFVPFLSLLFKRKTCFTPRKGIFCLFLSVSLCFSLAFFGLPLFQFLFLCLSLSLLFFSFFLTSCLSFLLSFGSLFLSLSLFFCLLCFCFMKGTTSKYSIAKLFSSILSLFLVSCLVSL